MGIKASNARNNNRFFMDIPFQLAMMAAEVLGAGLVAGMIYRKSYQLRPLFFAFACCLVVTSAAQFALCFAKGFTAADYASAYWTITAIETAFGLAALGELWNCGRFSIALGVTAVTAALRFPSVHVGAACCLGLLLFSVAATIRGLREDRHTPAGFVVLYFFQALAYLPRVPYEVRFLPVVAWMVVSIHWAQEIRQR
jgi:hypothetical protein